MQNKKTKIFKTLKTIGLIVILIVAMTLPVFKAKAGDLTAISDTMSRMKDTTASDHTIKFTTPAGRTAIGDTITITFPTGFTVTGVDDTDIDLSTGATTGYETELTLGAAAGAGVWGVSFTGQVLTFTHPTDATGDIAATNKVVVEIGQVATGGAANAQITNQTVAQNNTDATIEIAGNNSFDTGSFAVEIVADDQIVYSATVDPSITASFSANASSFGTITTSAVADAATQIDITIGTNGNSGFTATVYDAGDGTNPGLYKSAATTDLIGSTTSAYADGPTTLAANTEGYGINAATSGGSGATVTIASPYDSSPQVGGLEVGTSAATTLASATGPCSGRIVSINAKAAIDSLIRAGSYQDTVTVIVTGNF